MKWRVMFPIRRIISNFWHFFIFGIKKIFLPFPFACESVKDSFLDVGSKLLDDWKPCGYFMRCSLLVHIFYNLISVQPSRSASKLLRLSCTSAFKRWKCHFLVIVAKSLTVSEKSISWRFFSSSHYGGCVCSWLCSHLEGFGISNHWHEL